MNTNVIGHLDGTGKLERFRVRSAARRVSARRRFRNFIELSDWDEAILRHDRQIDAFCWMLAAGAAALLLPVCFLVTKG